VGVIVELLGCVGCSTVIVQLCKWELLRSSSEENMTTKTREYFLQIKVYFVAIFQKPCENQLII
jgi:hypothetical protein